METAVLCSGILGLLVFGLGVGVSAMRGRTNTVAGYKDDPADPLYKWIRAHGNTVEYAPMMAVLMLALGARTPASWVQWVMIAAVASRVSIAAGIILCPTLAKPHPLRFLGAVGTYLTGFALAVAMFL